MTRDLTFTLAQATVEPGGWADDYVPTPDEIRAAEKRWAKRSYQHGPDDEDHHFQCGGCDFFAALGADFGICWNEASPLDGCITFEHGGCPAHSGRVQAGAEDPATLKDGEKASA